MIVKDGFKLSHKLKLKIKINFIKETNGFYLLFRKKHQDFLTH